MHHFTEPVETEGLVSLTGNPNQRPDLGCRRLLRRLIQLRYRAPFIDIQMLGFLTKRNSRIFCRYTLTPINGDAMVRHMP